MTPSNAKHLKSALLEAKPPEVTEERAQAAECQLCHRMIPKSDFYKRKDRYGEYTWNMSYYNKCKYIQVNEDRQVNIEKYRDYQKEYSNEYYYNNKDKIKIIQKRYYYNKLSPEKTNKV
jgi:hypothetical protein